MTATLLTIEEAARVLRENPQTTRRRCRAGEIPARRQHAGRKAPYLIDSRDLARYVDNLAAGSSRCEPARWSA